MAGKSRRHRISDYKFSEYSHSKQGIAGFILGIISLAIFLVCTQLSYTSEGAASLPIGGAAIDALIIAAAGMTFSIKGYRDEDVYKMFPKMGIFTSGVSIMVWLGIIFAGLL